MSQYFRTLFCLHESLSETKFTEQPNLKFFGNGQRYLCTICKSYIITIQSITNISQSCLGMANYSAVAPPGSI